MKKAHLTTVESGGTEQGIPDLEGCYDSVSWWCECKATDAWKFEVSAFQASWHLRRARVGGLSYFAIRKRHDGGPRLGKPVDELWLYEGRHAADLKEKGLRCDAKPLGRWGGGPAKWDWDAVLALLSPGAIIRGEHTAATPAAARRPARMPALENSSSG